MSTNETAANDALQTTIEALAKVVKLTPEEVRAGLLKAPAEELRNAVDATDAVATFMVHSGELVEEGLKLRLFTTLSILDALGQRGPAVDLSALAEEVEVAQTKAA